MEAFINSAAVVALGELGDKTQVLALLLAVRYQRSWPILGGIFMATLLTMGVTALLGTTISSFPADPHPALGPGRDVLCGRTVDAGAGR